MKKELKIMARTRCATVAETTGKVFASAFAGKFCDGCGFVNGGGSELFSQCADFLFLFLIVILFLIILEGGTPTL